MNKYLILFLFVSLAIKGQQVNVSVETKTAIAEVSPFIFGKNNSFSSTDPNWILSNEEFTRIQDSGISFFRECGGNNGTKYNWRRKLSSHPDWYNNVYTNDWDKTVSNIQKSFPQAQAMFAFQLIGKAAKTSQFNFNDWGYNNSKWWEGVNQNLAGNGELNLTGTKAKKEGDANLYLENWNQDSTTAIIPYWKSKGVDLSKVQYWSMDNEPEIWNGTHDDVMPSQLSAEDFIQKYVAVAKTARELYPNIKLAGPVIANEWQWYNWTNGPVSYNGRKMPWLEFFIVRISEEEKKLGIKLLDLLDIHFYPSTSKAEELVQLHRVFFDRNYVFPEANGVKNVNGSWDPSQNKEYIFGRVNDWLNQNFGANHNIGLGLTELGFNNQNPNVTAVAYASMLGEFMNNKVEVFTPWSWEKGMWETVHLFSKNVQNKVLKAQSSNENLVSAYATTSKDAKIFNVILVNRAISSNQNITLKLNDLQFKGSNVISQTLKNLGSSETFFSDSRNAILKKEFLVNGSEFNIELAPLSITSLTLSESQIQVLASENTIPKSLNVYPNPGSESINLNTQKKTKVDLIDSKGVIIFKDFESDETGNLKLPDNLNDGIYFLKVFISPNQIIPRKIIIRK